MIRQSRELLQGIGLEIGSLQQRNLFIKETWDLINERDKMTGISWFGKA